MSDLDEKEMKRDMVSLLQSQLVARKTRDEMPGQRWGATPPQRQFTSDGGISQPPVTGTLATQGGGRFSARTLGVLNDARAKFAESVRWKRAGGFDPMATPFNHDPKIHGSWEGGKDLSRICASSLLCGS